MMLADVTMMSDKALYNKRRELLQREPVRVHNLLSCHTEDCAQCKAWRDYARELLTVNSEIQRRQSR